MRGNAGQSRSSPDAAPISNLLIALFEACADHVVGGFTQLVVDQAAMGLKQALHEQSRAAVRGQELGDFENAPVGLLRGALDELVDFLHRRVAAAVAAEQAIDVGPDPVEDHHADALAGPVLAEEGLERVELGILDRSSSSDCSIACSVTSPAVVTPLPSCACLS